jgi:hypothetical protein
VNSLSLFRSTFFVFPFSFFFFLGTKGQNISKKIRELLHEDRRRTIHELADAVGMDQLWSLPGDLNRKFEHAPHCREVGSPPLDK